MAEDLNEGGCEIAYWINFSSEPFRKWAACSLSINLIYKLFDWSHCCATSFGPNWNPSGVVCREGSTSTPSAVTVFRVPLWLDDRLPGVLSQTAVWEKGARGKQREALHSCLLSSQSSLFIFLIHSVEQHGKTSLIKIHLGLDLRTCLCETIYY